MRPYDRRGPIRFPKKRNEIKGDLKRLGFVMWWENHDSSTKKTTRQKLKKEVKPAFQLAYQQSI